MQKSIAVVALAALVAGCKVSPANGNQVSSPDIVQRLKSGDQTVCADPSVQQTAVTAVTDPKVFQAFQDEGGKLPAFEAVSATAVKKDVAEVSCSANLPIHYVTVDSISLEYTVRPSLDQDGGFVVQSTLSGLAKEALNSWIFQEGFGKRASEQQQNAAEPQDNELQQTDQQSNSAGDAVNSAAIPTNADDNATESESQPD
jgi:hypothetical protein